MTQMDLPLNVPANQDGSAPASETQAIALFQSIGRDEVVQRYSTLTDEANRRYAESYDRCGNMPPGFTAFNFLSEDERKQRNQLLLAMSLCIDERAEASERIRERISARKGRTPLRERQPQLQS